RRDEPERHARRPRLLAGAVRTRSGGRAAALPGILGPLAESGRRLTAPSDPDLGEDAEVVAGEHVAGGAVEHEPCARDHPASTGVGRADEDVVDAAIGLVG